MAMLKLFSDRKQNGKDWDVFCWETDVRMEELGLYKPANQCATCNKFNLYWKLESLDKGPAKDKIVKES